MILDEEYIYIDVFFDLDVVFIDDSLLQHNL